MRERADKPRRAEEGDVMPLKALWKTVFGDDEADIDHFFNTYFTPELTVVIDGGGIPVSAAYILPVGELVLPGNRYPVAMLYAIATHPEYRGRGYGEAVTRAATEQAILRGFPAVVLKPADNGLFGFYEKRTAFRAFFDACEIEYAASELMSSECPSAVSGTAESPVEFSDSDGAVAGIPAFDRYSFSPVTPAEYRHLRQRLLEDCVYIDTDACALAYQQYLCQKAGGGLYALTQRRGNAGAAFGCAVIEPEGDAVYIKELLLPPGCRVTDAVYAAMRLLKAEKYSVRTLSVSGENHHRQFGMLAPVKACPNIPYVYSVKWYGPAFD